MCLALQNSYFSVIHYQNRGRSGNKLCLTYKLNYSRIPESVPIWCCFTNYLVESCRYL